jgi:hypothetical protein
VTEQLILNSDVISNKASLLAEISRVCHFPDYFGMNWDALNDSIGEFSRAHQADKPVLVLSLSSPILDREPLSVATAKEICGDHGIELVIQ